MEGPFLEPPRPSPEQVFSEKGFEAQAEKSTWTCLPLGLCDSGSIQDQKDQRKWADSKEDYLEQTQQMAHGPNLAHLFLYIKFYWDTVMLICYVLSMADSILQSLAERLQQHSPKA